LEELDVPCESRVKNNAKNVCASRIVNKLIQRGYMTREWGSFFKNLFFFQIINLRVCFFKFSCGPNFHLAKTPWILSVMLFLAASITGQQNRQ
jgi:hypothetical protein